MTKYSIIIGVLISIMFMTFQFSEKDLIGKWKIIKVNNSLGSELDSTDFINETFTYKKNHTVIHCNPNNPIQQKQIGRWEIKNDTLFQFNDGKIKIPFKILSLTNSKLTIQQETKNTVTTI